MGQKVLILYAGGTIGMKASSYGYIPTSGFSQIIEQQLSTYESSLPDYDVIESECLIDSANLQPSDWAMIASYILDSWDDYSGFVILHGTDTMAYTASALSYIFQGTSKPIIVTGAQIPMTNAYTDGYNNLVSSLILAANYPITEVCLFFSGRLLRGNRSTKVSSARLDSFESPNFPSLGHVGTSIKIHFNLLLPAQNKSYFSLPDFKTDAVAIVQIYPGMGTQQLESLLAIKNLQAVVIYSYGAGNFPSQNAPLLSTLEKIQQQGIVLLNVTQCLHGGVSETMYATGSALNELGVVFGGDMTLEAAFTKLHYLTAIGQTNTELKKSLVTSISGEYCD